jgi:hypothetical protein
MPAVARLDSIVQTCSKLGQVDRKRGTTTHSTALLYGGSSTLGSTLSDNDIVVRVRTATVPPSQTGNDTDEERSSGDPHDTNLYCPRDSS